jgi:class 3 adenylate cyclase
VVGYSSLMERDEDRTLAQLKLHRQELVEPPIGEYQGHVVKFMGDGLLAEFASRVAPRSGAATIGPGAGGRLQVIAAVVQRQWCVLCERRR